MEADLDGQANADPANTQPEQVQFMDGHQYIQMSVDADEDDFQNEEGSESDQDGTTSESSTYSDSESEENEDSDDEIDREFCDPKPGSSGEQRKEKAQETI